MKKLNISPALLSPLKIPNNARIRGARDGSPRKDSKMSSRKCPQCGLVNFAGDPSCKRCGADLSGAPAAEPEQRPGPAAPNPKLEACPDCGWMISRQAEACPRCGRFIQRLGAVTVDRRGWAGTIALGILLIGVLYALITFLLFVLVAGPGRL